MAPSDDPPPLRGELSHLDGEGAARMVDVTAKAVTCRRALARSYVHLKPSTLARVVAGEVEKGAVFEVARLAGIQAAKRTWELIPLCHLIPLSGIRVDLTPVGPDRIEITAEVMAEHRTGVEMEALTAVAVAALTVYDMLKSVEKGITIAAVQLLEKDGGKSGPYRRSADEGGDSSDSPVP